MNGINVSNDAENQNNISTAQEKTASITGENVTNSLNGNAAEHKQTMGLMNGHKATTTTTTTTTTAITGNNSTGAGCCTMCDDEEAHTLDLSENVEMRQTLHNYWHIPSHSISQTLGSLCVQCIYKINAHKEMTRNLQMRLQRLTKGNAEISPSFLAPQTDNCSTSNGHRHSPPNTTMPSPRKELCTSTTFNLQSPPHDKEAASSSSMLTVSTTTTATAAPNQQQSGKKSPDSTIVESAETAATQLKLPKRLRRVSCHSTTSNSTSLSQQQSQSMLEVFSEQPESVEITESGGKINNYQRRERTQQLVCKHCSRVYRRKYHYGRHLKRCGTRHRWQAASAASMADAEQNPEGVDGVDGELPLPLRDGVLTSSPTRLYHCPTCPVTVRTMRKLREHRRIHLKRYFCATCGNESTALHDFELHRVICEAKRMAQLSIEMGDGSTVLDQPSSPSGSTIWLNPHNTLITGRMTRSRSLALSRIGAASSLWSSPKRCNSDASGSDDDIDDDGEVSTADTMYTKRMCLTGNWINDPDNTCASQYNESLLDFDDEAQIRTHKEYDLYLLSRLKAEILAGSLSCYERNCNFTSETLLYMMIHDYLEHFKRAWFYCRKCTRVFTSKVFLDYHLDRQNSGRFICFKCGEIFEFQHMLDRHLIRHSRSVNYRCNYCNFEFLTEHELLQHCESEQHHPNGERELIQIDPQMSITNVVPPLAKKEEADERRREFLTFVRIMHLPAMPTLRPMNLPNHQPYRRQIGDIEFKNQKIPNCWGWK